MTDTTAISLTSGAWTQISTGSRDVAIKLVGQNAALIHLGTQMPTLPGVGIPIDPTDRVATFANLPTTDNVYARAVADPTTIVVVKS